MRFFLLLTGTSLMELMAWSSATCHHYLTLQKTLSAWALITSNTHMALIMSLAKKRDRQLIWKSRSQPQIAKLPHLLAPNLRQRALTRVWVPKPAQVSKLRWRALQRSQANQLPSILEVVTEALMLSIAWKWQKPRKQSSTLLRMPSTVPPWHTNCSRTRIIRNISARFNAAKQSLRL